jgi:5-methylcytosine-specific restriction endonuclease McrA
MFSGDQRYHVMKRDKGVCASCGVKASEWQADHIRPLYKSNGELEFFKLSNLQTLCTACHKAKTRADMKGEPFEGQVFAQPDLLHETKPPYEKP